MKLKLDVKKIIHYLLIYLVIAFQGSPIYCQYQDILLIIVILGAGCFLFIKKQLFRVNKDIASIYLLLVIMLITVVTSGGSLTVMSVGNMIARFLLTYVCVAYDRKYVVDRFIKTVFFLSICSLLIFVIQIIDFSLIYNLPSYYTNDHNQKFYGGILAGAVKIHQYRNIGIATEPGRHQIYLITALFFLLFRSEQLYLGTKKKIIICVCLIVTLLTTQSTTGYIALMIVIGGYLLKRQQSTSKEDTKIRKKIKSLLIVMILGLIIYVLKTGEESFVYQSLIDKMFDTTGRLNLKQNTGSARTISIMLDLSIALKHPLGLGYTRYQSLWSANRGMFSFIGLADSSSTTGITSTLAAFGFPTWIMIMWYYIKNGLKNADNWIEFIIMMLILINNGLAQPLFVTPSMLILFLVPLSNKKNMLVSNTGHNC